MVPTAVAAGEEDMDAGGRDGGAEMAERVVAAAKVAEERGDPLLLWAAEAARCMREYGSDLPSPDLAVALVSDLCFANNSPSLWKLLDRALSSGLVSPLQIFALFTPRILPRRRSEPEAYRLYLELLGRYGFSSPPITPGPLRDKITKSVDDALQLSHCYKLEKLDYGFASILFTFTAIISLLDCTLEDWGLHSRYVDKFGKSFASDGYQAMEVDSKGNQIDVSFDRREQLRKVNAFMVIEVLGKITAIKRVIVSLRMMFLYMPERFSALLERLRTYEVHCLQSASPILLQLFGNIKKAMNDSFNLNKKELFGVLLDIGPYGPTSCQSSGGGRTSYWIAFDTFMENAMDGRHLHAMSAIEILTELTKTLQVINQASWQETFQALWTSALRLVQREREPLEGPVPHLDARLCILLSIVPLAIVPIVKEDNVAPSSANRKNKNEIGSYEYDSRKHGLVSSLQTLGQFSGLLAPPPSLIVAANDSAAKAATFVANVKSVSSNASSLYHKSASVQAAGNMLHLIVEACIARKLLDTSAYFWTGYLGTYGTSKDFVQVSPWKAFMEGAQLTDSLTKALMATPASSIEELEKLQNFALNGSEEEREAAAKILCSASLICGWNVQEYVVRIAVNLLSPPVPPEVSDGATCSHLIANMPMLNSLLLGLSRIDTVHILSLYGVVPEVAAALMPLCEVFGSLSPPSSYKTSTADEPTAYSVFSCAFLFLLDLWKFYRPPGETYIAGRVGTVWPELTLDALLMMRNSRFAVQNDTVPGRTETISDPLHVSSGQPVYIDSFPKLRAWYFQNQACIASTLPGMCNKNPVHQTANKVLKLICRKMSKGGIVSGNPSSTSSSSISDSPVHPADNSHERPTLPAWEILEAIPFVLEALLTACAYGKLSSRDLTTGLRDLVDYLPATLATIISYLSAELTRGIWKPVCLNGTDWPSPAANLLLVQSEVKGILASAGVHVPSYYTCGSTPVMLPLPMAALVSLTITFKLDKGLDYIHGIIGRALEDSASGCSWPSMPIIGALWTQKVRRWHDFIVVSCSHAAFIRDKHAVMELICSCFSAFLGQTHGSCSANGVNGLLGHAISEKGRLLPVTPGLLYLRSARVFHDTHYVNEVILNLVIKRAHELAAGWARGGPQKLKSGRISLAAAISDIKEAAMLGASLLCIAGGSLLVQVLYEQTLPTALLSSREGTLRSGGPVANMLEGYAMAYMLIYSGSFIWGVGKTSQAFSSIFSSRRARILKIHMDFVAAAVEGNVTLGCHPTTLKAYVLCYSKLLVTFFPAWIPDVKLETLIKLATRLRKWNENELALALLERGGPDAVTSVMDFVL